MWALPYQRLVAPSNLPAEELARRLTDQIEPPRWVRWPWDPIEKPFEGRLQGTWFKLWLVLTFQQQKSLAVVVGAIEPRSEGSILRAVIRLHWLMAIVLGAWIGVPGTIGLAGVIGLVAPGPHGRDALPLLAFAAVGYAFCMVLFWRDARYVKRVLRELAGG